MSIPAILPVIGTSERLSISEYIHYQKTIAKKLVVTGDDICNYADLMCHMTTDRIQEVYKDRRVIRWARIIYDRFDRTSIHSGPTQAKRRLIAFASHRRIEEKSSRKALLEQGSGRRVSCPTRRFGGWIRDFFGYGSLTATGCHAVSSGRSLIRGGF